MTESELQRLIRAQWIMALQVVEEETRRYGPLSRVSGQAAARRIREWIAELDSGLASLVG